MLRKAMWVAVASVMVTLVSLSLTMAVMAQSGTPSSDTTSSDSDEAAISVQPIVAAARVTQSVPVTLTLMIPGPTGPLTIEVPIFLNLDIQIGISPELTTTVAVTPSVGVDEAEDGVTNVAATPTVTPESTSTSAAPTATPTAAPTQTPTAVPTEAPTATPDAEAPTATAVSETVLDPTATPVAVVEAPLCPDPRAVIVAPGVGQVITGDVNVLGTATHEEFQYYKIEYAAGVDVDPNAEFVYLADARTQVTGGVLTTFDSTILDNGDYTLKLTVVDRVGNFPPPCTVSVVVAN